MITSDQFKVYTKSNTRFVETISLDIYENIPTGLILLRLVSRLRSHVNLNILCQKDKSFLLYLIIEIFSFNFFNYFSIFVPRR